MNDAMQSRLVMDIWKWLITFNFDRTKAIFFPLKMLKIEEVDGGQKSGKINTAINFHSGALMMALSKSKYITLMRYMSKGQGRFV